MSGHWFGPLKVVTQESQYSVWATMAGKLYRRAPEHIRPVCSNEARQIPMDEEGTSSNQPHESNITSPLRASSYPDDEPIAHNSKNNSITITNNPSLSDNASQSQDQPDLEPETGTPQEPTGPPMMHDPAVEAPVPESSDEDGLITTHLLCCEDTEMSIDPIDIQCTWRCELEVPCHISPKEMETWSPDGILLAVNNARKSSYQLSSLSPSEQKAFQQAKETEVNNWLKTGTVSTILRHKLAPEQILRCRWILVWKPLEGQSEENPSGSKLATHKPKARLVVLGYMDPKLTEVPRDSPTLLRQSKMIILQLIASMGWSLGSFDIKAAFLQGKPQKDRVIGLEPVVELAQAMNLSKDEICKLDKSAYGLIDASFLWFKTLHDELTSLGFFSSPFDPCVFFLKNPMTKELAGALGIHVDDGIYGGDDSFHQQVSQTGDQRPIWIKESQNIHFHWN